jgi:hypothetical protein
MPTRTSGSPPRDAGLAIIALETLSSIAWRQSPLGRYCPG